MPDLDPLWSPLQIGPAALAVNIAGLTLAFLLVGAMFAAIARLRPSRPLRGNGSRP